MLPNRSPSCCWTVLCRGKLRGGSVKVAVLPGFGRVLYPKIDLTCREDGEWPQLLAGGHRACPCGWSGEEDGRCSWCRELECLPRWWQYINLELEYLVH